jgi:hypothetical protein
VSITTPTGWYVDSKPIDQHLCRKELELSPAGSSGLWAVLFFTCAVDPPDPNINADRRQLPARVLEETDPVQLDCQRTTPRVRDRELLPLVLRVLDGSKNVASVSI